MKLFFYIFMILIPTKIMGEDFIIEKVNVSSPLYSYKIKSLIKDSNISIFIIDNIAQVSFKETCKTFSLEKNNEYEIFVKKKGKFTVNLYIKRNKYNVIEIAFFEIMRKNKNIGEILLMKNYTS